MRSTEYVTRRVQTSTLGSAKQYWEWCRAVQSTWRNPGTWWNQTKSHPLTIYSKTSPVSHLLHEIPHSGFNFSHTFRNLWCTKRSTEGSITCRWNTSVMTLMGPGKLTRSFTLQVEWKQQIIPILNLNGVKLSFQMLFLANVPDTPKLCTSDSNLPWN